jgi:hypothetical protein
VTGILKLAYKLLVNDKAKFMALLVGITRNDRCYRRPFDTRSRWVNC